MAQRLGNCGNCGMNQHRSENLCWAFFFKDSKQVENDGFFIVMLPELKEAKGIYPMSDGWVPPCYPKEEAFQVE